MISPDELVGHAKRLADAGRGHPNDADVRRGIRAAYYAVFHDLTERLSRHLVGSYPREVWNSVRRIWSHGEIERLAQEVVNRSKVLPSDPDAPLPRRLGAFGPLLDVAAADAELVAGLRLFTELQERRHMADYDHEASFAKSDLVEACEDAYLARERLRAAENESRQAFFTLATVARSGSRLR